MRWFTSDTHFNHTNAIEYDKRPYKDIVEMEECLIRNWNMCVSKKDIVYHLGDFAFGNPKRWKRITDRLQGTINLIRGNHDIQNGATLKRLCVEGVPIFNDVGDIDFTTIGMENIVMSHYPYCDSRFAKYAPVNIGDWLIHGHTHAKEKVNSRQINVSCTAWDYFPVSEVQILKIIKGD